MMASVPGEDAAFDESGLRESSAASAISEEEVSALLEKNVGGVDEVVDFMPPRINRTQLPMLEVICKNCAERMTSALSTMLGREVTVSFSALDCAKAGELQAALPVPGSLATVRLKPLPGQGFISVEPSLLLTLLDGFFGGSGRVASHEQAVAAPAAQRFLALLLRTLAPGIASAWAPVTPCDLEVVKQETNPRLMHLGAAQESMLALRFTVEFAAFGGRLDWLLPESLLAPIREALATEDGSAPARKQESWAPALCAALQEAQIETRAILTQAQISLRELVRLAPGDIIPIGAPEQALLLAGDVPLYHGRFGVSQGRNALTILPGGPA